MQISPSMQTHSEDRQGASVRSLLPTGYLTTTLVCERERNSQRGSGRLKWSI
jgi:hypothetical protein